MDLHLRELANRKQDSTFFAQREAPRPSEEANEAVLVHAHPGMRGTTHPKEIEEVQAKLCRAHASQLRQVQVLLHDVLGDAGAGVIVQRAPGLHGFSRRAVDVPSVAGVSCWGWSCAMPFSLQLTQPKRGEASR
jgi:hypothetical protein